ncbi:MAG: GNAT family N-acetyltransferase [Chloroflexota bacterium]|nr:GNAT family N-acetyltransferase [Chloroflexota bacterium]
MKMRAHPDFQGHGFGGMVLPTLDTQALALGYAILHLDTATMQIAAQHLYRKHGFKETGEARIQRGFSAILCEKRLRR